MNRKPGSLCATAIALAAFAAPLRHANAETTFSPAAFGGGEKSLAELIEFPELRGDTSVTVSCAAILTGRGKLDEHGCYQINPGDETFVAEIYAVTKKARLTPATYNGKPVDVVFQYRAHFEKKGEDETLLLMANPGYVENIDAYGVDHIAAQRLMGKESWQKDCPQHTRFRTVAKANVDWEGRPSAVSIEHTGGIPITPKCEQALIDTVLGSRFIPAFAEGEAVPSTFVEPFGN